MVCNMTGAHREELPFPVIIDSGACASVMPIDWCPHVDAISTPQSRAKEYFRAANGNKICNEGQKLVTMTIKEGTKRDMKFTICDVSKAIGSVSQMCRIGHRVIFTPPWDGNGSYIEHIDIGEKMWLEEKEDYIYCPRKLHQDTNRRDPYKIWVDNGVRIFVGRLDHSR